MSAPRVDVGTKRTWHDVGLKSVMRLGADITIREPPNDGYSREVRL